jgi:hypothetical protein
MQERRRKIRNRLAFPAVVIDSSNGNVVGHIGNITPEGVMLRSDHALQIDEIFSLQIPLPDEIEGCSRLNVKAHSLWSERASDPAVYVTGLEFLDISAAESRIIELLIQDAIYQRWIS